MKLQGFSLFTLVLGIFTMFLPFLEAFQNLFEKTADLSTENLSPIINLYKIFKQFQ